MNRCESTVADISFTANEDFKDPNYDGKLRPSEIDSQGVFKAINLKANFSGGANLSVDAWNPFINWQHLSELDVPYFWYPAGDWEHVFNQQWPKVTFFEIDTSLIEADFALGKVQSNGNILLLR